MEHASLVVVASERLTAVDTAWLRMEAGESPVDIVGLMRFDGELSEERLREVITTRLLTHRQFRQRIVDTRWKVAPPHWEEEPNFKVDDHLERVDVSPGSGVAELRTIISEVTTRPMNLARSPWCVYLVRGLASGSALVARLHHCLGDGFALMQILISLTDEDGREVAPERSEVRRTPAAAPRSRRVGAFPSRARLSKFAHLAGDGVRALGHLLLLPYDSRSTLRGPLKGHRRVAWCEPIPLSRVKAIGRGMNATVNDTLLAAVSGALRRYLAERGDAVRGLGIRAIVPVNLRPPDKPIDLEHGNWFGLVFVELPVDSTTPEERAAAVARTTRRIKASQEPLVSLGLLAALGRAPAAVEHLFEDVFARKGSLVVTNVPGPPRRLRLAGARIDDMMFWVPHPAGLGLGVSILSYAGDLRAGVRSDTAVVSNPEVLARYIEQEFDLLESRAAQPARMV